MEPTQVRLTIPDSVDPTAVMGPSDILLRRIEGVFKALISVRGTTITISGSAHDVEQALIIFSNLIQRLNQEAFQRLRMWTCCLITWDTKIPCIKNRFPRAFS